MTWYPKRTHMYESFYEQYVGDWSNDQMYGMGQMTHADGNRYECMWIDGKQTDKHFEFLPRSMVFGWKGSCLVCGVCACSGCTSMKSKLDHLWQISYECND